MVNVALWIGMGLLLGKALWCLVPERSVLDQNMMYLVTLGVAFDKQEQGDVRGAVEVLKGAIARWPNRYEAYMYLGKVLHAQGDPYGALNNYRTALQYCGSSATNLTPLQVQTRDRERLAERIRELEQVVGKQELGEGATGH